MKLKALAMACRIPTSVSLKFASLNTNDPIIKGNVRIATNILSEYMLANNILDENNVSLSLLHNYWSNLKLLNLTDKAIFGVPYYNVETHDITNPKVGITTNGNTPTIHIVLDNNYNGITEYFKLSDLFNNIDAINNIHTYKDMAMYELYKQQIKQYDNTIDNSKASLQALDLLKSYHAKYGITNKINGDTTYTVVNSFNDDRLANTSINNGISIKNNITVDDFFNPILGKTNGIITQLKKLVLLEMTKRNPKITLDYLKKLINNPYMVRQFILLHEYYHSKHPEDNNIYNHNNMLDNNNIQIETNANMYALSQIERLNNSNSITSTNNNNENNDNNNTPNVQEVTSFELPKVEKGDITMDSTSDLYKMSMEMDATQINNRVNYIAKTVSQNISSTILYKQEELEAKVKANPNDIDSALQLALINDEENGRRYAIPLVINDAIHKVKKSLNEDIDDMKGMTKEEIEDEFWVDDGIYFKQQELLMQKYFMPLLKMSTGIIESIEDIKLNVVDNGAVTDKSQVDEDNEDKQLNDDDNDRITGNDGWSFKARSTDPHTTIRSAVRKILSNLNKYGYDGDYVTDDLGNAVYLREDVAYATLINELTKIVHHPSDFMVKDSNGKYRYPALESLISKYKWVKDILGEIGGNPTLGSQLYTDLCKTFIEYWSQKDITIDGKTKRKTYRVNAPMAQQTILNITNTIYNEHQQLTDTMIWNKNGSINNEHINAISNLSDAVIDGLSNNTMSMDDAITNTVKILKSVGISTSNVSIKGVVDNSDNPEEKIHELIGDASIIYSGIKKIGKNDSLLVRYKNAYKYIADAISDTEDLFNSNTFRQGNADYPSYSTPNYIDFLRNGIKDEGAKDFIMKEFGYDDFLYNPKTGEYKSTWLQQLFGDDEVRKQMNTKDILVMDDAKYSEWTPGQIIKNFIFEYHSVLRRRDLHHEYGYYAFPIFSNSTTSTFIKMPKYMNDPVAGITYEDTITKELVKVAKQELFRMKKISDRKKVGASAIQRYDKVGNKFLFLPFLNTYEVETGGIDENGEPVRENLMDAINSLNSDDIEALNNLLYEAINTNMKLMSKGFYDAHKDDIFSEDEQKNITDGNMFQYVNNFYWNNALAQANIIQIMTTDLAYYKDYTDFQKRFKEVYASGNRLNTQSVYGRENERTIYLSDKIITSPTYNGVKVSLNKAVEDKLMTAEDRDNILKKFKDINEVDAQAYRTLSSYRAVLDMQGKWTTQMQEAFDRFSKGEYSPEDFNVVWGTIKPFVFTNTKVHDGLGGYQRVPVQNKNSEFLLMAFLNNYLGNFQAQSPQLRALNKFMEDNNIDVAQYESAVKCGGQGIVDINYSRSKLNAWIEANPEANVSNYEDYKDYYDNLLDTDKITQDEYNKAMSDMLPTEDEVYQYLDDAVHNKDTANPTDVFEPSEYNSTPENSSVVHKIPYEQYMIAQPTVNHLVDAESVFGSQFRNLITSDMDENMEITINGKTYKAKNEEGKNEIIDLYNRLLVENLLDDFDKVQSNFSSIENLQSKLLSMVKGNDSYNNDIINALQIVEVNGRKQFNVPLSNPAISNKLEQLVLAIFKNGITKQHINGAACVLASNFGFDNDLKVVRGDDGSIKAFECYMPAFTRQMFTPYLSKIRDNKGNVIGEQIDINKVKAEDPTLLEGIGYRIPTEGKYSMANLLIKGFLPQQNGAAIMMPAELTQLAGSDFDVDKLFMMLKAFERGEDGKLHTVKYDTDKLPEEQSKEARNNMIIDISRNILANKTSSYKINNPGNYDNISKEADRNVILRSGEYINLWKQDIIGNPNASVDEVVKSINSADGNKLKSFLSKYKKIPNPLSLETFAYYHKQNMTGDALIGIYANNTTMQAKYQQSNLGFTPRYQFTINGYHADSLSNKYRESNGIKTLISKNCAEFSAASVDNVKDPKLANLMQSTTSAFVTGAMLRMGLNINEIGLLFSMPFFDTKVKNILKEASDNAKKLYDSEEDIAITSEDLESILVSYNSNESPSTEIQSKIDKATAVLAKIVTTATELKNLTKVSRADSPNGAIDHTLAGAIKQVLDVDDFHTREARVKVLTNTNSIIQNRVISPNMSKEEIRKAIFENNRVSMPLLQSFYSLGIESFKDNISNSFKIINNARLSYIRQMNREYSGDSLPVKYIKNYISSAIVYGLSTSNLFSKDIEKQRAYYMNNYSKDFLEAKKNPEINRFGIIKSMSVDKGNIIIKDASTLKGINDVFSRDLDLMLMDSNPEVNQVAIDLFKYSYFKDGLGWRVNGFSNLFNTLFLTSIPSYIDTLRDINFDNSDGLDWNNFDAQFERNNIDMFKDVSMASTLNKDGSILAVPKKSVANAKNYNNPYLKVTSDGLLYELDASMSDNTKDGYHYYRPISSINSYSPIYNANSNSEDMIKEYLETNKAFAEQAKANDAKSSNSEDKTFPKATNVNDTMDFDAFDKAFAALEEKQNNSEALTLALEGLEDSNNVVCKFK